MRHDARQALANLAAHRIACPHCLDFERVAKDGWCITAQRLWRYYQSINMSWKAER